MTRLTISTEMARLALMVDRCAAEAPQSAGHPHILAEARMRPGTRDKLRGAFARLGYSLDAGVMPKGVEPFRGNYILRKATWLDSAGDRLAPLGGAL